MGSSSSDLKTLSQVSSTEKTTTSSNGSVTIEGSIEKEFSNGDKTITYHSSTRSKAMIMALEKKPI